MKLQPKPFTHNFYLMHSALFGLAGFIFLGIFSSPVYAEGVSFKVSPSVLQIRAQSPSEVQAPFTLENQSSKSTKIKIGYKFFNPELSKDGVVSFLSEGEPIPGPDKDIFKKMQVIDEKKVSIDTLELGPKQQKKLTLMITLPKNQPSADYYFSLIFLTDNPSNAYLNDSIVDKKDQKTISIVQGGIGVNVLLAVGPDETAQGYIDEFSTDWFKTAGPVPFTIKVKNTGLHYLTPKGVILVKNIFGQAVGRIELPATVVLAGTTRSFVDSSQPATSASFSPQAIWPEKFLLGFYSANLNISMSPEGPTYNRTIRFAAFPVQLALVIFLIFMAILLLYLRFKKKI